MKKYLLFFLLSLYMLGTKAQTLRIASAPSTVAEGEMFRIVYSINSSQLSDFTLGTMPAGVRVEAGPMTSSQSSFQMINGHTTSSSTTTLTYFLSATKGGNIVIPPAIAVVGGKKITSPVIKITVSGQGGSTPHQQTQPQVPTQPDTQEQRDENASNGNLFIKPILSKQTVHEQEAIVLTYKIYTKLDVKNYGCTMPDLKGFHIQKLPNQKQTALVREGNYDTAVLDQYIMYPQVSGKLQIPSVTYSVLLGPNRNDPMSMFGQPNRRAEIVAKGIELNVEPLPTRPAGFSGAVGSFSVSAQVDNTQVKAGDPISLRVIVDGTGNLKLIPAPSINVPKDFDKYDPKTIDKSSISAQGLQGSMIYDYVLVPRKEGKQTIPSIDFVYFDIASNSYKTLKTNPIEIDVQKGDGKSSMSDFSDDNTPSDIRGIMEGDTALQSPDSHFFGSGVYFVSLLLPIIIFIILFLAFRKHAVESANIARSRGKKANKVATKRLQNAAVLMGQNKQNEFYDEVLRALWGYVGDKLNIPAEYLSKDNISDNLMAKGINNSTIEMFIQAIDDCEYARYAPGDPKGMMEHVYERAITAITHIDNMLNQKTTTVVNSAYGWILLLMVMLPSVSMSAATKLQGDEAYAKENYEEAINIYNDVLKQGVSPELYYNLGNAYFRANNIPQAVLCYERAYRLSPGNSDIRYNLKVAQSKTIDKIAPENRMFFADWYHSCINFTSADNWAIISVICVILLLVSLVMYLFVQKMVVIKTSFYFAVFAVVVFVLSTLAAFLQHYQFANNAAAIIMSASVEVKATPADNASEAMILHEGTHVDIIDNSMKEWVEVRTIDGRSGWIKPSTIEII